MEDIVGAFIKSICDENKYEFLSEANSAAISKKWAVDVPVDKSSRRYDYAIYTGKELVLVETNFYGGGGSKLKSTAGEYRNLYDVLGGKFKFVWVTDGNGWNSTLRPLEETFAHNDYLLNLRLLEEGALEEILGTPAEAIEEGKELPL